MCSFDKIVLATAHKKTRTLIRQHLPGAKVILFKSQLPDRFMEANPAKGSLLRRFEIIPGKEALRRYSASHKRALIYYTDADQWVSPRTLARAYAAAHINDIVRIPIAFRMPEGPDDCGTQKASTDCDAFNCFFMRSEHFSHFNLYDLTKIKQASRGGPDLFAPDNTLFQALKMLELRVHDLRRAYTRHYYTDEDYWEYLNGSIHQVTVDHRLLALLEKD